MSNLVFNGSTDFPITRQTLYDMWSTGLLSQLATTDFASSFQPITVGTGDTGRPSGPQPGSHYWDTARQLMYLYIDESDNTGCSIWCAIGPDRFEIPMLAAQPIAAGALVMPLFDRWVAPFSAGASLPPLGINQKGIPFPMHLQSTTAASGTWISVGVEGFLDTFVVDSAVSSQHYTFAARVRVAPDQIGTRGGIVGADAGNTNRNPKLNGCGWALYFKAASGELDTVGRVKILWTGFQFTRIVL